MRSQQQPPSSGISTITECIRFYSPVCFVLSIYRQLRFDIMVAFPTVPSTFELSPPTTTHAPTGFLKRQVAGVALTCRVWPLPKPQTRCCTTTTVMSTGYCELPNTECPRDLDLGPCSPTNHRDLSEDLSKAAKVGIAVAVTVVVAVIIGLLAWKLYRARSTARKARAKHSADGNAAQDGASQQPQQQQRSRRQEAGAQAIAVHQPPHVEPVAETGRRNAPPNPGLDPPAAPQIVPAQDQPVVAGEGQDNWAHLPFPPGAWIE